MSVPEPVTSLLLVDDRFENLVALEALLEPLGQRLVTARSGEEALRRLLEDDFAVILLDVQMPGMDGFETAAWIKKRERTRHVPIIFLTALSKDAEHVFHGYEVGAVDYLFKPYDPTILRSKVAVFVELFQRQQQVRVQGALLREAAEREQASRLDRVRASEAARYQALADSMPQIVWTIGLDGALNWRNRRWAEYAGRDVPPDEAIRDLVHPDDIELLRELGRRTMADLTDLVVELRLRRADDAYRWHLVRAVVERNEAGTAIGFVGTATDVDENRRTQDAQRLLADASEALGDISDLDGALKTVAEQCVPRIADACAIDLCVAEMTTRIADARRADLEPVELDALDRRLVPSGDGSVVAEVLRANEVRTVPADGLDADGVGQVQVVAVPMVARGEQVGCLTLAVAAGRSLGATEERLARDLAGRLATAVDNDRLLTTAQERAQASEVLASVGDGVFLVDGGGVVRLWNPAAEAITGLAADDVVGGRAARVIPGWTDVEERVPVLTEPGPAGATAETLPIEVDGREVWLSISGVGFAGGTIYAFRDLTGERAVDRMKTDFVATVSHELRTPLAAIYGAASTLQRDDIQLPESTRDQLLSIVSEQAQRLAEIVNDVLLASRVDAGHVTTSLTAFDPVPVFEDVVAAARTRSEAHRVGLRLDGAPLRLVADQAQLRQVLVNLVENAIKYSPAGGEVEVRYRATPRGASIDVRDEGMGIPQAEQARVFEKFYRVDADMNSGIGGTGLGLYICRELVRHMGGRLTLASTPGAGTTFSVELPTENPREAAEAAEAASASAGSAAVASATR